MIASTLTDQPLAILGGPRAVRQDQLDLFHWPIVTTEDEQAVVAVMRAGSMSGRDITEKFEAEYAAYQGTKYALGHCNGTAALLAAMYACGVRRGDEIIVPSITYWASALPAFSLGATVVFADIDPDSLCIDPADIERHISKRTKAIVPVHYCGHPADMDPIVTVARRHGLKVIEDVSHAHGGLYKGRMVGTFGDVAALSMMAGKSFAIGEAGMLCTDDRQIYERAIAFAHYQRHGTALTMPELKRFAGLPLGGIKGRMNQTCSAMGRVQLRHYPERIKVIQDAMNRFWDLLDGTPGVRPHRPPAGSGSTMGGWYNPVGHYVPEEVGGLSVERFIEAVNAEGGRTGRGCNFPLHLHPVLNEADVYGDGKPTRIAFADRDVRQPAGSLPVSEALADRCFGIPWFKHDRPEPIARYAAAYRKVALQADKLPRDQRPSGG
ncbi:MAG TPA: DegT/DnrJ/EryC1/StrS family aminotransferase [Phycisphaerae bacterium]|nr:DegT/DnrJ/EryC1/StrS family aminotransferase [Phycisphaerae bacterium]